MDDMKEGFASQTMLMAQMKTSLADMKGAIDKLNKVTSEEYIGQEETLKGLHVQHPH